MAGGAQPGRCFAGQRQRGAHPYPFRAPLLPIFCARLGFGRYVIDIGAPIDVPPKPRADELDRAAQSIADAMTRFLREHPTQWLMFE